MKPSTLLLIYLFLAIAGGLGVFYYQSTVPDNKEISNDVTQRLLTIDGLNSDIGELVLRSRYNLDPNYDSLTRSATLLDQSIESFGEAYFSTEGVSDPMLVKSFEKLKSEVMIQRDLIESFKSHNSVLRNSEKYAPAAGQSLMSIAKEAKLDDAEQLYGSLVRELLAYSLLGSSFSIEKIKVALPQLVELENKMPEFSRVSMFEFGRHIETVINEKELTDQYLSKVLLSTSDSQIDELSQGWSQWLLSNSGQQSFLKQLNIAYISFLLVGLAFVTWRLRNLYQHLDHEVAVQTEEVKKAFDELKESETKLVQSEKMASLGQMVAGVAHEINTPLGYISSNVDTIRLNMGELDGILKSIDMISVEISESKPNTKKIGSIVKRMVQVYRRMRQRETLSEIEDLLKDSSYGLSEISNLVGSLKDFSRLDRTNAVDTDIHKGLEATLKICKNLIGERKVVKSFDHQMPLIECMPAQLNQVFLNIVTNSAQATDKGGTIKITTKRVGKGIEISFEDNGEGMSANGMKQIFDPFYTTKDVGQGTGLGMSIAYKIVKSHGGEIKVKSEIGKGTQILVQLPLQQSQAELSVIK